MFEPCRQLPHQQGERADTERVDPARAQRRAQRHGVQDRAMKPRALPVQYRFDPATFAWDPEKNRQQ
jgi:hypothetical protein